MNNTLLNNPLPKLALYKECTGCFACVAVCPKDAIEALVNDEGHYAIRVKQEKCVHCGKCEITCNNARLDYGCNDLSLSKIYAGYTTDNELRRNATSGGIFAAIAKVIIETGGVVAGASFDGTYARHIIIDNEEDIAKLQGSKYTPSTMNDIYKEIEKELPNRRVLFSGTGCQVAGILAYFKGNKNIDNLYTVDLVCGGVPSIALVRRFNEQNRCKITSFRNKDQYELTVENEYGVKTLVPRKNLPLDGFAYQMTNRFSCYDCQFAFCHRKSDVTIGDLWDYNYLSKEHKNGVSMLLVHTEKARKLISNMRDLYLENVPWLVIRHNYRVVYGKERIYWYRKRLAYSLKKMSYDKLFATYTLDVSNVNIRLILFKIYRHFMHIYDRKCRDKYITSLLNENGIR